MKKLLALVPALAFCLLFPLAAFAEDPVGYLDENGQMAECGDYTLVEEDTDLWTDGWYVVEGSVTIPQRIETTGSVCLILTNGCRLYAGQGISVDQGASLTIYAQTMDPGAMGELDASGNAPGQAVIGGDGVQGGCGDISIHGGDINASATGSSAPGIGAGSNQVAGVIRITGGTVNAQGSDCGSGIGAGWNGGVGQILITGGNVTGVGGAGGAGIGGPPNGSVGTIEITGGTVTGVGGPGGAPGIGGLCQDRSADILLCGGIVYAIGGDGGGSGICGNDDGNPGTLRVAPPEGLAFAVQTGDSVGTLSPIGGSPFAQETDIMDAVQYAPCFSSELTQRAVLQSVKVSPGSLDMTVGESEVLNAETQPAGIGDPVAWASGNDDVVVVDDNGVVTAVGTGNAVITATVDGFTDTCMVSVWQPVTGVSLDKTTLNLMAGDQATLNAAVQPSDASDPLVNWQSSDWQVAYVDQTGTVRADNPGSAVITVTTEDGGRQAQCTVTVTPRTYALKADPASIGFGSVNTGYSQPAAKAVTVTNTGNQTLNLSQPAAKNFVVSGLSSTKVGPGATVTFTVQPKEKLGAGQYSETVTVSGENGARATVALTFTVTAPKATATPKPTPLEMHTLHFNTMGGLPMDAVKFGLGAPVELWPYTPVRTGYLFQGWYEDEALTKPVSTIVLVKDTTIYAKWAADPTAQKPASGSTGKPGGGKATATPVPTAAPAVTADPVPEQPPQEEPGDIPEQAPEELPEEFTEPTPAPEAAPENGGFPLVPVAAGAAAGAVTVGIILGVVALFRRRR